MRTRSVAVVITSLIFTLVCGLSAVGVMAYLRMGTTEGVGCGLECRAKPEHPAALVGLWTRWPDAKSDGDLVRFWFFHPDGIGLYRYGKIGLNTTNSFDWQVEGDTLVLRFRKTGEVVTTPFVLEGGGKPRSLTLKADPREPHAVPYMFVPAPQQASSAADLFAATSSTSKDVPAAGEISAPGKVAGRLWIDQTRFATGGTSFSLYQLKDAAIDGRGVGWHHIGDYDDWSTEALTFRYSPSTCKQDAQLEMWFTVRGEHANTLARRKTGEQNDLVLFEDPRSYWQLRTYHDAGPSFGSFASRALSR